MDNRSGNISHDDLDGIMRPAQNPALVGHDNAVVLIEKMLAKNHIHHALLFEGQQGIGKATFGIHLAWHMLSNRAGQNLREVDVSSTDWHQITVGTHPGLLYISRPFDSKAQKFRTSITVEEIRKIMHFLHQTSAGNGWRVVMIDSVDDINRDGANALLKILEEPPPKALFILISHCKGRLLSTVRSRCQAIHFKPLNVQQLQQVLLLVSGKTAFEDDEQTEKIIHNAEGSVRQALLMLQFGGGEIVQSIENILCVSHFNISETYRLANALAAKDAQLQYVQFVDYLLRLIAQRAVSASLSYNAAQAERLAGLYQELSNEIMEAQLYNLDKKHFILVLLNKIHNIFFS